MSSPALGSASRWRIKSTFPPGRRTCHQTEGTTARIGKDKHRASSHLVTEISPDDLGENVAIEEAAEQQPLQ